MSEKFNPCCRPYGMGDVCGVDGALCRHCQRIAQLEAENENLHKSVESKDALIRQWQRAGDILIEIRQIIGASIHNDRPTVDLVREVFEKLRKTQQTLAEGYTSLIHRVFCTPNANIGNIPIRPEEQAIIHKEMGRVANVLTDAAQSRQPATEPETPGVNG